MGGARRGGDTDGLHSRRRHHHQHRPSHNALPNLADGAGVRSLRKQGGEPGMHSNSLFGGNRLCTPKRAGRTPMKMLIDDEVSRYATPRHTVPGIVGRLMGLDVMPSSGVHSQDTCNGNHLQGMSPGSCSHKSGNCSDKYALSGDVPRRTCTDEVPEFKDVFEVMETTRMKNLNRNTCFGHDRVNNADLNFVRQKFIDAKRLSTDGSFQKSEDFNDALEALVSNKDVLMEILQESNNVAASDLSGLSCSPLSGVNRITLLKPSRRNKFIDADVVYPPENDTERCFRTPKEAKHSPRKLHIKPHAPKEETGSLRQKLSRSSYRDCIDKRISPTRIVVLKPYLDKTQNMEGAFPLTDDIFCSSDRRTEACLDDGIQRLYAEESIPQASIAYSDAQRHREKGPREIAREVSLQMRTAGRGGVSGKQKVSPDIGTSKQDEQVSLLASMAKLKTSAALERSPVLCDSLDAPSVATSPTHSSKRSIRKEAKRRLSDRWKVAHQHQHPSREANTFSTLGDMLALSDKEVSELTAATRQQCPVGKLHRDVIPGSCGYPLGISSNDGWKDENICNISRLESISTSSINRRSQNLTCTKASFTHGESSMVENIIRSGPYDSEVLHQDRQRRSLIRSSTYHCDESDVPCLDKVEREIHVNFEEPIYTAEVPELSETGGRLLHAGNSCHSLGSERYLNYSPAVPNWQGEAQSSGHNKIINQHQASTLDDNLSLGDSASQTDGNEHDRCEDNQAPSDHLTELVSVVSSNEDDHPSPVSVLESSLDAEDCCSGGLRMQLRLLKMEAAGDADETELALFSDDETAASCELENESAPTSCTFWDEDERDFSYVVNMLNCLGIQSAEQDLLLDARCLLRSPACSDVYDNLEKKYSKLILWPQSERRLLFDLTNDILVDTITCLTQCGSQGLMRRCQLSMKWGKEEFVQEVWERVCRQRRETECFQEEKLMGVGWLDCEDVTEQIAADFGGMVCEDLLEEAIADLNLSKHFG
ncbi:hypothetical protein QYE76_038488 [Lolium multiflorum]|uniref:DUF4378 domain-containing protein n=1 Tax=Lolium multiflorum TaxID=4521 RepID=A0AAD8WRB7_LOLMU|nr:hypothetical protein QYE76_038488 [Lolium multiflorum]